MFNKLAFAAILGASYATTAEAAGSCLAKDDNAWAAIGLTVTTATATDVAGLGAIGAAAGWHEDSTDSANAVCAGGAALAALTGTVPGITGGSAGTASANPTTGGAGSGLVADVEVTDTTTLTSITVTTAGTGYTIGDVLTFPAEAGGTGDHAEFTYTLVAGDFDAFTATGVTANPTCDNTDGSNANFAACGSGFTIKADLTGTCATDTCQVSDCCTENACTAKADAAAWKAVGVTVVTADATTVTGLGTIGTAAGWTGSATVTCPQNGVAFGVAGVSAVSGKCSGNFASDTDLADTASDGTFQFACGAGFTVKGSSVPLTATGATAQKAECCTANPTCDDTDGSGADFAACGSGFTIKSDLTGTCATDTCQVSDCCTADATTSAPTTSAPTTTPEPEPESPAPAPAALPTDSASTQVLSVITIAATVAAAFAGL